MDAGVLLINPKTPYNVGSAIRACSIFDTVLLRWTGTRITAAEGRRKSGSTAHKDRLPREERMKDYAGVDWQVSDSDRVLTHEFPGMTPVCVEFVDGAQLLPEFEHPERAVYVFGPEDGSVPKGIRVACHYFVRIPSSNRTPFNLATAVSLVLYDRFIKTGAWIDAEIQADLVPTGGNF
jgi:tRNA(Leu) C34 or U34 (ribose-2'-O)-methylase TrmL